MDQDECSLGMFLGGGAEDWAAGLREGPPGAHASSDGFVKSLLVMEYADLGTLHAHLLRGHLRGDLVRAHARCRTVPMDVSRRPAGAAQSVAVQCMMQPQCAGPNTSFL